MAAIDFNQLFETISTNTGTLARQMFEDETMPAKEDAQAFLNIMKEQLQTWTQQYADGDIDSSDFAFLVKSQNDCYEMVALKNAGIPEVRIDEFKDDLISCITDTVNKAL